MKTCCVTGNRPEKFPFDYKEKDSHEMMLYTDALYRKAEKLIRSGYTEFLCGMARGADLDFACALIYHKEETFRDLLDITLEAVVPHPDQTKGWRRESLETYEYVLAHSDRKTLVSPSYFLGCEQKRNRYMVEKADLVFAVWNGEQSGGTWNTIRYARQKQRPIAFLMLKDFLDGNE